MSAEWIPCGSGFIEADVIRWTEGVWRKPRRNRGRAINIGELQSVAVPFVGAAASTLVVAEVLRLLHGGPSYASLKLRLAASGGGLNQPVGTYSAQDFVGLTFCEPRQL